MKTIRKSVATALFGLLIFIWNSQSVSAAMVEWSWTYGTQEPVLIYLFSSDSFDVNIKITNDGTSDRAIYLGPYEIPEGFYYEGFYEFQSYIDKVADTIIQPGDTSYLNLGKWVPVMDGPAPYVNIAVQPQYLEIYYYDENGNKLISGKNSLDLMQLTIHDAFLLAPYDPYNPGQGLIHYGYYGSFNVVPVPSSFILLGTCLLILLYRKRAIL